MTPGEHFLSLLQRVEQVSDPSDVFDFARGSAFDGQVTFHFQNGLPKRVEVGRPVQIPIVPLQVLTRVG